MGVKVKHKIDKIDAYLARCKDLDDTKVNVGVLTGEHQW